MQNKREKREDARRPVVGGSALGGLGEKNWGRRTLTFQSKACFREALTYCCLFRESVEQGISVIDWGRYFFSSTLSLWLSVLNIFVPSSFVHCNRIIDCFNINVFFSRRKLVTKISFIILLELMFGIKLIIRIFDNLIFFCCKMTYNITPPLTLQFEIT